MNEVKAGARVRAEAAHVVDSVSGDGRSLDAALLEADLRVKDRDRPLLRMLCYGVLRHHWQLREHLQKLLDRPLKKRDRVIESLLLLGFFQLSDTRIPDHAAVSMTVEAARTLRRPKFVGLMNAVLRNYMRRNISESTPATDEAKFNHPAWLIDAIREDWPEHWSEILEQNNERAPMWLRTNRNLTSPGQYLKDNVDIGAELVALKDAIRLNKPVTVELLPGFSEGKVSVQDGAAQIAAPWLLDNGGKRVLDACAAPGGKTGHLLEILEPGASLVAVDKDPQRLESIGENLVRIGREATLVVGDASTPDDWLEKGQTFDRILLDAPCSASGVIRRHPDIKLHRRPADIQALARLQRKMLEVLWITLEPAGRLLYVTCSVLGAENEAVVDNFLSSHEDAIENRVLQNNNIRDLMIERSCGFQILPGSSGLDGFYFACLDKKS